MENNDLMVTISGTKVILLIPFELGHSEFNDIFCFLETICI